MIDVVRASGVGVCVMHMQGTPQTMQDDPAYGDVVAEVRDYLRQRRDALIAAGIERERICLDPGIGFGKTHQHSLTLMANCWRLHELGCPLLVGHSRKGFIGKLIGDKDADRTAGTVGGALALAQQGVQIVRVHDVRVVREALVLFEACGGSDGRRGGSVAAGRVKRRSRLPSLTLRASEIGQGCLPMPGRRFTTAGLRLD